THILTQETMALLARESPSVAPILKEMREDAAALMEIDGKIMQKHVPRGLWDVEWRLGGTGADGVGGELVWPPTPQGFSGGGARRRLRRAAERPDRQYGRAPSAPVYRARRAAAAGAGARRRRAQARHDHARAARR